MTINNAKLTANILAFYDLTVDDCDTKDLEQLTKHSNDILALLQYIDQQKIQRKLMIEGRILP